MLKTMGIVGEKLGGIGRLLWGRPHPEPKNPVLSTGSLNHRLAEFDGVGPWLSGLLPPWLRLEWIRRKFLKPPRLHLCCSSQVHVTVS